MLGNFMEDIGITPVQFEDACNKGNRDGIPITFDQVSFTFSYVLVAQFVADMFVKLKVANTAICNYWRMFEHISKHPIATSICLNFQFCFKSGP